LQRELDLALTSDAPVLALYGPSGAGKSLALRAIAGLQRAAAGHVRIAGATLFDSRAGIDVAPQQRGMGVLFQHYALFPRLSVRDNIAFGLRSWRRHRLSPGDAQRVDALVESFGLGGMAHSRPAALSGGQQQRVALARALACEPRVLLLDEPFAALDAALRTALRSDLKQLRQRTGIPMLLVTHDLEDLVALADRVVVMQGGRALREFDLHQGPAHALAAAAFDPQRELALHKLRGLLGDA
jgi:molybdate transport system ATP-binding protein